MTHADPTGAALFATIQADPADDDARLVYADWLEEFGGDPDRAALIRAMVYMARHRDCPELLRERARGTWPLPMRCGRCDFCRGRRAWNTSRIDWWPGGTYGYELDPSFLDPTPPPHDRPHLIVRRGFVEAVLAPTAELFGGPCGKCDGHGTVCEACEGEYVHDDCLTCDDCGGAGRTPGVAADLARACPLLERVTLTDRSPLEWASPHWFSNVDQYDGNDVDGPENPAWLPWCVARHLGGPTHNRHYAAGEGDTRRAFEQRLWYYSTEADAQDAASAAALAECRARAAA